MNKNTKTSRGPGRPMAVITIPKGKFTFADLKEANQHVTELTLRKFLARDAKRKGSSTVVLLKDETREPDSKDGLGRKTFVYTRRVAKVAAKPASKLKTASKSKVAVDISASSDYEAKKAAILAPEPIAETPAPEAIAADTSAVAAEAIA